MWGGVLQSAGNRKLWMNLTQRGENSKQHHELLNSLAPLGGKRWQALDVTTTQHFMLYLVSLCVVLSNLLRGSEEMKLWLSTCLYGTSEAITQKHLCMVCSLARNPNIAMSDRNKNCSIRVLVRQKQAQCWKNTQIKVTPQLLTQSHVHTFGLVEWCWNPPPWFRGFLRWVTTFLRGKAKVKGCAKCDKHQFDVITSN